ncbi:6911_t:CDS:2 [Diversispora eburnea]|uniref:6911_t:CDS:1 n=1 Tax=Diversispora eburnea TaxID=1213867 RepID=A0A9N9ALL8_9GLOM|nr:6911_t:CDS:2 [Diversispora eburnea]
MGNSNSTRKHHHHPKKPKSSSTSATSATYVTTSSSRKHCSSKKSQITSEPGESSRFDSYAQNFHLPKNHADIDRMQIMHFLLKVLWGNNYSSPIEPLLKNGNARILDVGCGPGTWLLELATNHPHTQFTGIDITKAFPSEIKPKNLQFIQYDINNGLLPFPDNHFDFVKMSNMNSCLKDYQWDLVLRDLVRVLKPGGYIELMECDMIYHHSGPLFSKLIHYHYYNNLYYKSNSSSTSIINSSSTNNKPSTHLTSTTTSSLINLNHSFNTSSISLINVKSDHRNISVGIHGGKSGKIYEELLDMYFADTVIDILPKFIGVTKDEFLEFWKRCRDEFTKYNSSTKVYRFWAQKSN